LNDYFKKQVKKTEEDFEEYQELNRDIEEKISQFYRFETIENPIKFLNEEIWQFSVKLQNFKRSFHVDTYWEVYGRLQRKLLEIFESNQFQVLTMKYNTEDTYKSLSETKKCRQTQDILLQDFELLSKSLGIDSSIPKTKCEVLKTLKHIKEINFSSNKQQLLVPEEVSRFKRFRIALPNIEKISACLNHSFDLDPKKTKNGR